MSFLSMVLSGQRGISEDNLDRIAKALDLSTSEASYLKWLRQLVESQEQPEKLRALERIQRFRKYRNLNPKETEVFKFHAHWYYVAIRELVALPDFSADPLWIQSHLRFPVPLLVIKQTFEFLLEHKFIARSEDGKHFLPNKLLDATGGVFNVMVVQFHTEMLKLIEQAIHDIPKPERHINSCTVPIGFEDYPRLLEILDEMRSKILQLSSKSQNKDSVYHISIGAIPIGGRSKKVAA